MTTPQPDQTFDQWCIVEIFGHERIAGRVTEQRIGGTSFVRVDVPATGGQPEFTRLYSEKAIYSITPVSQDIALRAAAAMQVQPVSVYYLPQPALNSAPPAGDSTLDYEYDNEDEDDYDTYERESF